MQSLVTVYLLIKKLFHLNNIQEIKMKQGEKWNKANKVTIVAYSLFDMYFKRNFP